MERYYEQRQNVGCDVRVAVHQTEARAVPAMKAPLSDVIVIQVLPRAAWWTLTVFGVHHRDCLGSLSRSMSEVRAFVLTGRAER